MTTVRTYRGILRRYGREVEIERPVPNGEANVIRVHARIRGATEEEIAGGIKATERRVLVLAEDVPLEFRPLRQGDRVLVDGMRITFSRRPDDQAHRDGDTLLAYEGFAS